MTSSTSSQLLSFSLTLDLCLSFLEIPVELRQIINEVYAYKPIKNRTDIRRAIQRYCITLGESEDDEDHEEDVFDPNGQRVLWRTRQARLMWGHASYWDTSKVTDMSGLFEDCHMFNEYIGKWDVSQVTTMNSMFSRAFEFNQPLDHWDIRQVEDMSMMNAFEFNQPLDHWNVSKVTCMSNMLKSCISFNQALDHWDVSSVTDVSFPASQDNQSLIDVLRK